MSDAVLFVVVAVLLVVAHSMLRNVRRVPPDAVAVIERFGRYHRTAGTGWRLAWPVVERVRRQVDLAPQVRTIPQLVVTKDGQVVEYRATVHLQVVDPVRATYEVARYDWGVEQVLTLTLRKVVADVDAADLGAQHRRIQDLGQQTLREAVRDWGIEIDQVVLDRPRSPASSPQSSSGESLRRSLD